MINDLVALFEAIGSLKQVLSASKDWWSKYRSATVTHAEIAEQIAQLEIENRLRVAQLKRLVLELKMAELGGYELCRRHNPPGIMQQIPVDSELEVDVFTCQVCGCGKVVQKRTSKKARKKSLE